MNRSPNLLNRQLQLPHHRPFDEHELRTLLDDMHWAIEDGAEDYFIGSIILAERPDNTLSVTDGSKRLTSLLFCAKNPERIGDRATNIAEIVHYMITAEMLAAERPKADESSGVELATGLEREILIVNVL